MSRLCVYIQGTCCITDSRVLILQEVSYLIQCLPAELIEALVSCAQDAAAPLVSAVVPVAAHLEDPKAAHPR